MRPGNHVRITHPLCFLFSILFWSNGYTQAPVAEFSASPTEGCLPLFVSFTDLSAGNPTDYTWNLGNGATSKTKNPQTAYLFPGVYTVTLTVTNPSGTDTEIKTALIIVYDKPMADFVGSPLQGCVPFTVQFQDASVPSSSAIQNWYWDFGDGIPSTQQDPSHTYTIPGVYSVNLIVTDGNGCLSYTSKIDYISVGGPTAAFIVDSSNCPITSSISFLNNSTGSNLTYQWDFGDGGTSSDANPSHSYAAVGTYTVELIVTDDIGCSDTVSTTISGFDLIADFEYVLVPDCGGSGFSVNFYDSSSPKPNTYIWTFGNGDSSFTQNPFYTYTSDGSYLVQLIVGIGSGCQDTISKLISYFHPLVSWTADTLQACQIPFTVNFSGVANGIGLSYKWDFGDGDTTGSTALNTTHIYTTTGLHVVSLTVTDTFGCSASTTCDSVSFPCILIREPIAFFILGPVKGCAPLSVNFFDASTTVVDSIIKWQWNFGDPASGTLDTSSLDTVSHLYNDPGEYYVTLIIETVNGCRDTIVDSNLVVGLKPDSIRYFLNPGDTICYGDFITFIDSSFFNDTSVHVNWWCWVFKYYFGDFTDCPYQGIGMRKWASLQNVSRYYEDFIYEFLDTIYQGDSVHLSVYRPDLGLDSVFLRAGYNGCYDSTIIEVFILPPAAAPGYLMYDSLRLARCAPPLKIGLFNGSYRYDSILNLSVTNTNTGDTIYKTTNPDDTVVLTFTRAGLYRVDITASNDTFGCTHDNYGEITIDSVISGFRVSPIPNCFENNFYAFTDTSYLLYGTITKYYWDWGDGFIDSGAIPAIVKNYAFPGTYTVKRTLTVENNYQLFDGAKGTLVCFFTDSITIVVNDINAGMAIDTIIHDCSGVDVVFRDISYTNTVLTNWWWDFGDSTAPDLNQHPTHEYAETGLYTVTLAVQDSIGCVDTLVEIDFTYVIVPRAVFGSLETETCANDSIHFTNASFAGLLTYSWNFGDGSPLDTSKLPIHQYTVAGLYTVSLVVTDPYGCADTMTIVDLIRVNPNPVALFFEDTSGLKCPPVVLTFTDSSSADVTMWFWDFGDGQNASGKNPTHIYNGGGIFTVSLLVTNAFGCMDSLSKPSLVNINGPSGVFSFAPDSICVGDSVFMGSVAINTDLYIWDFGDGTIAFITDSTNGDSVAHPYLSPGLFLPSLTLRDSIGCTYIIPSSDFVYVDHVIAGFAMDKDFLCKFGPVQFTDTSFTFFGLDSLLWTFGDGDSSSETNPLHIYNSAGTFLINMWVQSAFGCIDVAFDTVIVHREPWISANPNDSACIPFEIQFMADTLPGSTPVSSWNWDFDDGSTGTGTNISHTFTQARPYIVTLTAEYALGKCSIDSVLHLAGFNQPHAQFNWTPRNPTINYPEIQFFNLSSDANLWFWDFGTGDTSDLRFPAYSYIQEGNYSILLIASNDIGCLDSIRKRIYVAPDYFINVPNAFTPNGDGNNDVINLFHAGIEELFEFRIFDRFGNKVFSSTNLNKTWDGTHRGKLQPMDVYVYYLKAKRIGSDEEIKQRGYITLIR